MNVPFLSNSQTHIFQQIISATKHQECTFLLRITLENH
jgi:hypothetical protein